MESGIITQPDNDQVMKDELWREGSIDKSYIFLIRFGYQDDGVVMCLKEKDIQRP